MHISDTPTMAYSAIKHLIALLNPDYIVHTGDLADNIKLELHPDQLDQYSRKIKSLASILLASRAEIYITIGNHDHLETVKNIFPFATIFRKTGYININDTKIGISHYHHTIDSHDLDLLLYGHNLTTGSQFESKPCFSNALEGIFIYDFKPLKVHRLSYPLGTDDVRMSKFKAGI
jgi:predicted phosphodiesterase